ncbi:MAG: hypothetical protein Q4A56_03985 [Porphyromonadaceae bacterium]|nr:hypothetical protein [Porphyromonadaceae bacterium]
MESKFENNNNRPVLDPDALRAAGLERIRQLSGNIWSDHNATDPGITMLEAVSFSILDLGYRTTFDIRDLLTEPNKSNPSYEYSFHEPYSILPSAPLTINDYRKLILENIEGIKNVWLKDTKKKIIVPEAIVKAYNIEKTIEVKGFYDVFIDVNSVDNAEKIVNEVSNLLHKNRNICEDFNTIDENKILKHLPVGIEADIEVNPDENYSLILEQISEALSTYISPDLRLYTLEDMLSKGKSVADIFTGPFPKNGYVDIEEMEDFDSVKTLYVSDVIKLIMQIKGVVSVRSMRFVVGGDDWKKVHIDKDNYQITINESDKYVFRFDEIKDKPNLNKINFLLNNYRFNVKITKGETSKTEDKVKDSDYKLKESQYRFEKDNATNRDLDRYYTVQNDFPSVYLVGTENIARSETDLRKAQRLQMKGYLTFFDQLFADFLTRLNSAKKILSWDTADKLEDWETRQKSYLQRILTDYDIDDFHSIVDEKGYADYFNNSKVFNINSELDNQNRALNHLLARFGESFVNFSILQYIANTGDTIDDESKFRLIKNKSMMLKMLPTLGYRRTMAIDYRSELSVSPQPISNMWYDYGNYYAIEQKLYIKLGINDYSPLKKLHPKVAKRAEDNGGVTLFEDNRATTYTETFGLHIYEHNLLIHSDISEGNFLRQYTDDSKTKYSNDPYSMKVTVVLPGWLNIVQNHQFREIIENAIKEELPAHIAVKICWIDPMQMLNLEQQYDIFIQSLRNKDDNDAALSNFVGTLSRLKNIYQEANLDKETLLGYTTLVTEQYKWKIN